MDYCDGCLGCTICVDPSKPPHDNTFAKWYAGVSRGEKEEADG